MFLLLLISYKQQRRNANKAESNGQVYEIRDSSFSPHPPAPLLCLYLKPVFVSVVLREATRSQTVWFDILQRSRGQAALCLRAGVGLNVFNVSFYLYKSAPIR